MPATTEEQRIGSVLGGKYRLDAVLGRGGVGTVFLGTHTWTERPVAVKLLDPVIARDEEAVQRFLFEAKTATKLRHPNVVDVLDMGADDRETVFLVMERLEGKPLADVIEAEAPLAPSRALEWILPVLDALEYSHAQGVIHRDLKPDNIFIHTDASGVTVPKLLDFGIAKALQDPAGYTEQGTVLGTPHYMSPEQIRGEALTPQTDVWSIGVVLYEALTGKLPFEGPSLIALLAAIQSGRYPAVSSVRAVPPALEAAIDRALQLDPNLRPAGVGALRELLAAAEDEAPTLVDAEPEEAPTPPSRSGLRFVMLTALAALLALGAVVGWRLAAAPDPAPEPETDESAQAPAEPAPTVSDEPALRFAVSGTVPRDRLSNEYAPLVRYLREALGREVELVTVSTYGGLSDRLIADEVDLAWLPALEYVRVRVARPDVRLLGAPVESESDGSYQGLIVTPRTSGIETLEQLRGRSFCYVSPTSASGYLYPRAVMRAHELDPDDLFRETRFVEEHTDVLPSMLDGTCDAGATYAAQLHGAERGGISPTAFRILATTESIPYGPYVASAAMPEPDVERVRQALLAASPGGPVARRVFVRPSSITGVAAVEDAAYDVLRDAED